MITALKLVGGPGSIGFLFLCGAIGLFLIHVWPRKRALGRCWLLVVFCLYLVLGTPLVAQEIADSLSRYRPVQNLEQLPACDVVVTLGGDNLRGRLSETRRALAVWRRARIVLFADDWLLARLLEAGIPAAQITHDPRPSNTFEQMDAVRKFQEEHPDARVAVVASRIQMPRIAGLAEKMHLPISLLPSPIDVEPPRTGSGSWQPRYTALRLSRDAIYEHAALAYYRWRGLTTSGRNQPSS